MEERATAVADGVRTTDGAIAMHNLNAQIDSLAWQLARGAAMVSSRLQLIELITLRGQILGRIADAECAVALAEHVVLDDPEDGGARVARARTRAYFHRFSEAAVDLDAAARLGANPVQMDAERVAILQATGLHDAALALCQAGVTRQEDFESISALAGLHAERGEIAEAERLFDHCRARYHGVSPFPLAQLDFQRGHMWQAAGDLRRARGWFAAATRRLPAYAPARGHLAEVEATLGAGEAAITRLRPLTDSADDPAYAAQLAHLLGEAGHVEACVWRDHAAVRYDDLVARHPEAFVDHAAEFWLTAGGDPDRALALARWNVAARSTPRARELLARATLASQVERSVVLPSARMR